MTRSIIRRLLERPIAFHRIYVDIGGSVNAGLFLAQSVYWTEIASDPETGGGADGTGWFWKTAPDWEREIGLTRREQETARGRLRDAGVLLEEKRGVPAKLYFRVDMDVLIELCETILERTKTPNKDGEFLETRMANSYNLDTQNSPSIHTEITLRDYVKRLPSEIDKSISDGAEKSTVQTGDEKRRRGRPSKPETEISGEFAVSPDQRQWARGLGLSDDQIDRETELFRDYHLARGTRFRDWAAAWRTWIRNVQKFDRKGITNGTDNGTGHRSTGAPDYATIGRADDNIIERRSALFAGGLSGTGAPPDEPRVPGSTDFVSRL